MTNNDGKITKENRDRMPGRGRSNKSLILEALRRESFENLTENSSNEESTVAFFQHIIRRARSGEADKDSGMLLKWLGDKGWASLKPVMGAVEFDFDANATESEQAKQILKAASEGHITPDVAQMFVNMMTGMLKIEEVTEIKEELIQLRDMIESMRNES